MGEAKRKRKLPTLNDTIVKLSESGPMELIVVDPFKALFDSDVENFAVVSAAIGQFASNVASGKRSLCLLCDVEWNTGFHEPPPALMAIMKTAKAFRCDDDEGLTVMASGICESQ
jgi:hypothetical protein